ncbi:hypothetical protein ERO13_A02G064000v2 [Gossypium hirsutum]|uniref:Uncharacterized protein n=4 Tax=Gossypium TaxID=3633 RepID=A0A5J5WMK7_GOSBA|nr:hypothetical protein ES319_A02G069600v1 [Gossypium barbadense]KAG4210733.1 hypothetical protein ERO13_A02G064000v2 [Gossypium hirsutum]TYH27560.1 hypothetical protein ES288_A02G077500v1 [Gossypium darwinii]TYI39158.1 hypothetical protein ES332_A02G078000v1 [Gossypium tomentosum]TYJ45688.1 hypothetical protein E1A91_A02G073300v1 [Gossypium mustelinum]
MGFWRKNTPSVLLFFFLPLFHQILTSLHKFTDKSFFYQDCLHDLVAILKRKKLRKEKRAKEKRSWKLKERSGEKELKLV